MPSSRSPSWLRDQTGVSYISCIGRWLLYQQCHLPNHTLHVKERKPLGMIKRWDAGSLKGLYKWVPFQLFLFQERTLLIKAFGLASLKRQCSHLCRRGRDLVMAKTLQSLFKESKVFHRNQLLKGPITQRCSCEQLQLEHNKPRKRVFWDS